MKLRGIETSAKKVYDELVESINNVYNDVVKYGTINRKKHDTEHDLFHNEHGVVEGPW